MGNCLHKRPAPEAHEETRTREDMRRVFAGVCAPAVVASLAAAASPMRVRPPVTGRGAVWLNGAALSHQRCSYFSVTPVDQGWFSRFFGGGRAKRAGAAEDAPAVVAGQGGEEHMPITVLLARLSDDKETTISFLVKLMRKIAGRLREKQQREMQSVVDETNAILAAMRSKLQALIRKVEAAETLLSKHFPTKGEQPKLEDVEAFMKNGAESADEPKK